jgi:Zn-dependent protease with chaperone function
MRWLQLTILGIVLAGPARGEDIIDVLRRSQQQRLETLTLAPDGARHQAVVATFEKLRQTLQIAVPVELKVIRGPVIAETLHGRIIVANESLADLPESERLFVIAHELGHVVNGHWAQMGTLFKRWVPDAVTPEQTNPVSGPLGRDASGLAHRHEFEADAFALQAVRNFGGSAEDILSAFMHLGMQHDTATHPGTRKRWAALRAIQVSAPTPAGFPAE